MASPPLSRGSTYSAAKCQGASEEVLGRWYRAYCQGFQGRRQNTAEGRDYRRSYYQLTVISEALMTAVVMRYKSLTGGRGAGGGKTNPVLRRG